MPATNLPSNRSAPTAFAGGAVIGALGGLIGLGGAEFRLPLLIGAFRFPALQAVILNKAMSLDRGCLRSAVSRGSGAVRVGRSALAGDRQLLAGSLLGAWFGAGWATKLASQTLYRVIAIMLLLIAVVLVIGHDRTTSGAVAVRSRANGRGRRARASSSAIVAALLGVAGGELLIPTLVLLFGADIKLAGSLSLAVSLPDDAGRLRALQSGSKLCRSRRKSRLRAGHGDRLNRWELHRRPTARHRSDPVLLPLLALILVLSAFKVWRHK